METTSSVSEEQAMVLLRLAKATRGDGQSFCTLKQAEIHELPFARRLLGQMAEQGLVEDRPVGARGRGWRLTGAGAAVLPEAQARQDEADRARRKAWEDENLVYGVPRPAGAPPMNERQQRAWMRGFVEAQLATLPLPMDAPAEVRENDAALRAWMARRIAPHRPMG